MRPVVIALCVIVAAACSGTQAVVRSVEPVATATARAGIGGVTPRAWVYAGALFLPADPNTYSDVVSDAKPLADGGWVVLHAPTARPRFNCDPSSFGCGALRRQPIALLQRLDASGRVVAQEHGSEPFALTRLHVFESLNVVIGQGPQVVNGTLHAFRLDTLDGIASQQSDGCIASADRCFGFRTDYTNGTVTIEERDARDLRLISSTTQQIASVGPVSVLPAANLVAWRAATDSAPFVRYVPLDPTKPLAAAWPARAAAACDVAGVADDRAVLTYGPAGCRGDSGWHSEIIDVSTGRTVRALTPDQGYDPYALQHGEVEEAATGIVIDPRDGSDGPAVTGPLLHVDWTRGLAAVGLADGGVAVLKRESGSPAPRDVSFRTIATGACAEYEFPRIMAAEPSRVTCGALAGAASSTRLLVATGRAAYAARSFTVARVVVDQAMRTMDVTLARTGTRTNITDASPASVIELGEQLSGAWLIRLVGDVPFNSPAFAVRL